MSARWLSLWRESIFQGLCDRYGILEIGVKGIKLVFLSTNSKLIQSWNRTSGEGGVYDIYRICKMQLISMKNLKYVILLVIEISSDFLLVQQYLLKKLYQIQFNNVFLTVTCALKGIVLYQQTPHLSESSWIPEGVRECQQL